MGNGRLGRLLIILYLASEGYLESPYIYPSAYFNRHKVEYVEQMRAVSEDGAWDEWLRFFLEGLRSQAEMSYDRTHRLRDSKGAMRRSTQALRIRTRSLGATPVSVFYGSGSRGVSRCLAPDRLQGRRRPRIRRPHRGSDKERGKEYKAVEVFDILQ